MQHVHINRLGVNSIEFETDPIEVPLSPGGERSFEMVIINYGSPTHVHLSASESLKDNVTFLENNPYVRHEEYIPVIVRIPAGGRLFTKGEVFVTVGYGSKKEGFIIKIGIPDPEEYPVDVDVGEQLSKPPVNSGSRVTRDRDAHFHEVSAHLFKGFYDAMTLKVVFFIALLSILTILFFLFVNMMTLGSFENLSFYPAIVLSILFTAFIAYLLLKLPIIK